MCGGEASDVESATGERAAAMVDEWRGSEEVCVDYMGGYMGDCRVLLPQSGVCHAEGEGCG